MANDLEAARVRISKVTLKRGGAVISVLPTATAPDDTNFVDTLVWILKQARRGRVVGYAAVFSVETDDGRRRCMEAAKAWDSGDEHHVLGLMQRMMDNYIRRTWGDDDGVIPWDGPA